MLDVRRLRTLREVAVRGSISGAARALNFTPSAVSQQLARLEQEAGVPLLERRPSSVELTDAARVLVAHTEEILARLHEAEAEMRVVAQRGGGELRITSFPTAAATIVPAALATFSSRHPEFSVTLVESEPVSGAARVRAGEFDLGLVWEYDFVPAPVGSGLTPVWLLDDPIRALLPPDHPLAGADEVDLGELAGMAWITSTPRWPCSPFTRRACQAVGFEPRIVAETDDHRTLQRLVAEGVGAALETELSLRDLRDDVAVLPLAVPLKRRIFAVHREDAGRAPRLFAEILVDVAKPRLQAVPEPAEAA
jgi:DNA-binding transcriptional LysR family regulator